MAAHEASLTRRWRRRRRRRRRQLCVGLASTERRLRDANVQTSTLEKVMQQDQLCLEETVEREKRGLIKELFCQDWSEKSDAKFREQARTRDNRCLSKRNSLPRSLNKSKRLFTFHLQRVEAPAADEDSALVGGIEICFKKNLV